MAECLTVKSSWNYLMTCSLGEPRRRSSFLSLNIVGQVFDLPNRTGWQVKNLPHECSIDLGTKPRCQT